METTDRPMVCDCGSTNISTQMDVGCDIDPSGEERQHLDTCRDCGKTRLWCHRWDFCEEGELPSPDYKPKVHWGKKWSNSPYGV